MPVSDPSRTFYIRTFGCQMNVHDSGRMAQLLLAAGYSQVDDPRQARLLIVNTCSVRAKPEHKALSEAGRYRRMRNHRGARIILAGCVAQQEGERLLHKADYLDAVIGPDAITRLPEIAERLEQGQAPLVAVDEHDLQNPCFVPLGPGRLAVSVPVTIMKGCNNYCSYCIVPYVRGREVSRGLDDVLREVEELAERGCREVTLLGQNVNSYRDPGGAGFPDLLAALDRQAAVERIRFTTSHPKDLSPGLVEAMASLGRVCEHVHLALQSGSDGILQKMNRGYTGQGFLDKVDSLRSAMADISITTDLIVGFPTETEDDFRATLDLVRSAAFDQAFSFKYSPRPRTAAARMPDDVPPEVKARRLGELQSLLSELEAASLARFPGSAREVLVEGRSLRDERAYSGRTRCNRVVNFTAQTDLPPGTVIPVGIIEARGHTLWGGETSKVNENVLKRPGTGLTKRSYP